MVLISPFKRRRWKRTMSTILVDQIRVSARIEKSVDHASSLSDLGPGFYNGFPDYHSN